jgi:hypothetical protein
MVVKPPAGASPLHFLMNARWWFEPWPEPFLRRVHRKPVTIGGRMMIQRIPTRGDLIRVLKYDMKEIERRSEAVADWKFIADLTGRQRA